MSRTLRWPAVAAAAIAAAVAVSESLTAIDYPFREPRTAVLLAPLQRAPLPAQGGVMLVLHRALTTEQAHDLLMEAAWQRPDVEWSLPRDWPSDAVPAAIVTVGETASPPGWRRRWREGPITVWKPSRL